MLIAFNQNPKLKSVYKNTSKVFRLFVRLLRKRIVLAIIFTLSFTYCLVSLVRQKSVVNNVSGTLEDYETNVDIEHLQHMIRQSHRLNHEDNHSIGSLDLSPHRLSDANPDNNNNKVKKNAINDKSVASESKCRNSIQGKVLIADDRGFVCPRKDVLLSGCCDPNSINTKLYSCETCQVWYHWNEELVAQLICVCPPESRLLCNIWVLHILLFRTIKEAIADQSRWSEDVGDLQHIDGQHYRPFRVMSDQMPHFFGVSTARELLSRSESQTLLRREHRENKLN